jgi:alcohol dehydrogenase class IV
MTQGFRSVTYPTRLVSGPQAVEAMSADINRLDTQRAFVVSGRSIAADTESRSRIEGALGRSLAGWFSGIEKDSTYTSVAAATVEARAAGADLIVAVGGGSVIVAGRAVAIFLAENRSPFEIMTQYPEGKPAYSPRLGAPKPPIVNIVTTPNTAMNRAGTGLKNDDLDHRMEYFDPKTRPAVIVWDDDLLMRAPLPVFRSAAATILSGAVQSVGALSGNPLADGDRLQALRLAAPAFTRLGTPEDGAQVRMDLMITAFLSNRISDFVPLTRTGRGGPAPWGRGYAVNTALHLRYHHIGQGEATAVITPVVMRRYPQPAHRSRIVAESLGLDTSGLSSDADFAAVLSEYLRFVYSRAGMATRLRDLRVPRQDFPAIVADTAKNFNANPGDRNPAEAEEMFGILNDAW